MTNARAAARLGVFLAGLAAAAPASAQWGQFRGPNGSGVDTATGYPAVFSPTEQRRLEGGAALRPVLPGRRRLAAST